jgi:HAD superfamily hydrolase (TIGR01509 family)
VLVDSEAPANRVLVEMMREVGLDMSLEASLRLFRGRTMPACWELIEAKLGRPLPDDFAAEFDRRERAALGAGDLAMPGIHEALAEVDALGIATCVASSGSTDKMRVTLGGAGLWRRFEGRIFSAVEHVTRGKPHPDVFEHAARACGASPAECTVVEDSPLGVEAARAAGMRVLGFAREVPAEELRAAGADVFFALEEIPRLVVDG